MGELRTVKAVPRAREHDSEYRTATKAARTTPIRTENGAPIIDD
jgi:hypothetical protein